MKSTFNVLFYLKRDKIKKNGSVPIFCRITINKIATRFNLKLDINPKLWNVDFGRATGKSKEATDVNYILESTLASLHTTYRKIIERDNYVTAEKVKNAYLGLDVDSTTLLQLFQQHNDELEKQVGVSIVKATMSRYKRTYNHLEAFMKSQYRISDIPLREIDLRFITDFELYLRTSCDCNVNTTNKFITLFKKIVTIAKNNGWVTVDPFGNHKIRYEKVDRGYLTDEELQTMKEKDFGVERLNQVRDVFIFSCYTGLAYVDVSLLKHDNIRKGFDNNLWIMTKREKTSTDVNVPLLKVAEEILDKYKGKLPDNKILPIISNQKMNAYLKEIGTICKIEKNLTFHLARHTFSTTVTLSKGVPIESVSKMLGHTNIQTTQIYARITNEKISNDMINLSKKLESAQL